MMAYLTRPAMARGGRIGFQDGSEADTSPVYNEKTGHIYKKGNRYGTVYSKTPGTNQSGALTRTLEEVQELIDKAPKIQKKNKLVEMNPKDLAGISEYNNVKENKGPAKVFVSRKELKKFKGKLKFKKTGKDILEDKSKKNLARQAKDLARSNPGILTKLAGKDGFQLSHLSLGELDTLKNLGYLPAKINIDQYHPFEKKIVAISKEIYELQNNKNLSVQERRDLIAKKQREDRALRKQFPQYAKTKARLQVLATSLDPSGVMIREKLPDPSIAIAPTEAGTTLKEIKTRSQKATDVIEIANLKLLASFGDGSCAVQFGKNKKDGGRIGYATGPASLSSCLESGAKNLNEGKFKTADQVQDAARLLGGGKNVLRGLFKYGVLPEAAFIAGESLYRTALGEKPFNAIKKSIDSFTFGLTDFTSGIEAKKFGKDAGKKLAVDKFRNSQALVDSLQKKLANLESITDQAGEGYVGDLTSDIQMTQAQLKTAKNELRKNTVPSDIVQFIDRKALDIADAQTAKSDFAKQSLKDQMEGISGIRDYTDTESIRIFPKQPSQMDLNLKMLPRMPTDLFTATPSGIEDYAKQLKQQGLDTSPRDVEAYRDLLKSMSLSESADAFSPEQVYGASGLFSQPLAGGGRAGLSGGDTSGPPPEIGPMSQGLPALLKRVKKL